MKFYTIALFLGVITAEEYEDELANQLKISVSRHGERVIEKEASDVGHTWDKIEHSRPVRNLEASLKRWCHSKEVLAIKKLDAKFLASPQGKRFIAEWKDVGRVIKKNLKKTKHGLHFPNNKVDELSDEIDDVADQYEHLHFVGKNKGKRGPGGWNKKYERAYKAAFTNKPFGSVMRRGKAFKHSKEGAMLKKEIVDLKKAIHKHLKITDLPKKFEEEDDLESLLKVSVSKHGERVIEKEASDIKQTWKKIENSAPVRNVENSFKRWASTKQVKAIEALDRQFLASPEGKRLMAEWRDFGRALKKAIVKTKDGLHIKNSEIPHISDELDDVADQYEELGKGKGGWKAKYDAAWKAALTTKQAKSLGRRLNAFKHSKEGKMLHKEIVDLKRALKKHLKITDLPKKNVLDSDSDDDDEEEDDQNMEEIEELIKISISKKGRREIEKEWNDVEHVWEKIKNSRPVRNVEASLKRWGDSKEMDSLKRLDKKFSATPLGKRMSREYNDVFEQIHDSLEINKKGELHIDNKDLQDLDDEIHDVEVVNKEFKKTPWAPKYKKAIHDVFDSKSAHSVYRRAETFKKSAEGKALKKELKDLKMAIKKNLKVTDIPKGFTEEEEKLYLY